MAPVDGESIAISLRSDADVTRARQAAARLADVVGLPARARARLDLVVSELATNVVRHAISGSFVLQVVYGEGEGISIQCTDRGPGINGRETRNKKSGLGLGLLAAGELADELTIDSAPGLGTRAQAIVWA